MLPERLCVYCGQPAEGNFSIHRDGFGDGPEVDLCNVHGVDPEPTCEDIWVRISMDPAEAELVARLKTAVECLRGIAADEARWVAAFDEASGLWLVALTWTATGAQWAIRGQSRALCAHGLMVSAAGRVVRIGEAQHAS